ncbi:MAG: YjjG family noncanonical pyrimidine nucleotidase [Paludibacteraceae bacterium]|nr:YjjG family noncanonical pyrimidine nucleotidase [Paludibacteraceae bacterium]
MKQYKAVFIDWDDTLGDFHGAADLALAEMYDKYQLDRYFASLNEFVGLYKPHNLELWAKYGEDKVTKEYLSLDRFWFPLMHASKLDEKFDKTLRQELFALAEQLSEDFLHLTTAHFSLLPGAEDLVRYLARKYPLTIVTNGFIEVQYEKFEKSGLRDCFAHVVLSEEVGCQKPNPRIFEEALRLNGLQADEVVMVGDSWYSDIQGAINAGIDQIWVTEQQTEESKSTYIVKSLEEIKYLL